MIENLPPLGDPKREVEEGYARDTAAVGYIAGSDTVRRSPLSDITLVPVVNQSLEIEPKLI